MERVFGEQVELQRCQIHIVANAEEPYAMLFRHASMAGPRSGELFGLKVEDLDFDRKLIFIRRSAYYSALQSAKTPGSVRVLPMTKPLSKRPKGYLRTWRPNAEGFLFATKYGTPICANNVVQRILWPILDKLGIPRCGLRAFRHTHSTLLVDDGAPMTVAQAQMGHADARTTLGIYSHVIPESQRKHVENVSRILDSSGPQRRNIGKRSK